MLQMTDFNTIRTAIPSYKQLLKFRVNLSSYRIMTEIFDI